MSWSRFFLTNQNVKIIFLTNQNVKTIFLTNQNAILFLREPIKRLHVIFQRVFRTQISTDEKNGFWAISLHRTCNQLTKSCTNLKMGQFLKYFLESCQQRNEFPQLFFLDINTTTLIRKDIFIFRTVSVCIGDFFNTVYSVCVCVVVVTSAKMICKAFRVIICWFL